MEKHFVTALEAVALLVIAFGVGACVFGALRLGASVGIAGVVVILGCQLSSWMQRRREREEE